MNFKPVERIITDKLVRDTNDAKSEVLIKTVVTSLCYAVASLTAFLIFKTRIVNINTIGLFVVFAGVGIKLHLKRNKEKKKLRNLMKIAEETLKVDG